MRANIEKCDVFASGAFAWVPLSLFIEGQTGFADALKDREISLFKWCIILIKIIIKSQLKKTKIPIDHESSSWVKPQKGVRSVFSRNKLIENSFRSAAMSQYWIQLNYQK